MAEYMAEDMLGYVSEYIPEGVPWKIKKSKDLKMATCWAGDHWEAPVGLIVGGKLSRS